MPKVKAAKTAKALRHNPLAEQIIQEEGAVGLRRSPRAKLRRKAQDDEEATDVLPANVTQKVLEVAQAQKADEDDGDIALEDGAVSAEARSVGGGTAGDGSDVEIDEEGYVVMNGATEEEERALALFLPGARGSEKKATSQTLADVILQKIQDHESRQAQSSKATPGAKEDACLSPKVLQVYGDISKWLKTYRTGKLPKAFKIIPSLNNWEEVLALTSPLTWSPAAMYEAVAIFASNLNPRMAQRFYNLVLLPAVRQDIADHKKLNFHYYRSLRKALFKPAAFFKGVVLPLAAQNCTLREAVILSSVMTKASIPPLHAAASIVHLCAMTPWYGTTSILLATLVNKKHALPLSVIESLVAHMCAFASDSRSLPVVWHRALLTFVQRYKLDLNEDQRRRLKELLRVHFHEAIGAEVRRELLASRPMDAPGSTAVGAPDAGDGAAMDVS